MFGIRNDDAPVKKRLKLSLDSEITINLIDVVHIDLHPSFVRPEGAFFIKAIGELKSSNVIRENQDAFFRKNTTVYAENNGLNYLIEIESIEDKIEHITLYQSVLKLTPTESEWPEVLELITSKTISVDDVIYSRVLGGNVKTASLLMLEESIKSRTEEFDCENQVMSFERKLEPHEFTEKLKAMVEIIESREQASVSLFVGFNVHPLMVNILGN